MSPPVFLVSPRTCSQTSRAGFESAQKVPGKFSYVFSTDFEVILSKRNSDSNHIKANQIILSMGTIRLLDTVVVKMLD